MRDIYLFSTYINSTYVFIYVDYQYQVSQKTIFRSNKNTFGILCKISKQLQHRLEINMSSDKTKYISQYHIKLFVSLFLRICYVKTTVCSLLRYLPINKMEILVTFQVVSQVGWEILSTDLGNISPYIGIIKMSLNIDLLYLEENSLVACLSVW